MAHIPMIVLGAYVAQIPIKSLFTDIVSFRCSVVRFVFVQIVTVLIFMAVPDTYKIIRFSILIEAAAPMGSNVAIFAQFFNEDYTRAVKDVCMSTLLYWHR